MPNHVHFIAVPGKEYSLSKTLSACHMCYAHYINRKNRLTGHLWQGRFYSCILGESHLYAAVRYIENNPVRANLVEKAWEWNWSSARAHSREGTSKLLLGDIHRYMEVEDWKNYLCQADDKKIISAIIKNTSTGRPSGSVAFVSRLEGVLNRRLRALPRGRPKNG